MDTRDSATLGGVVSGVLDRWLVILVSVVVGLGAGFSGWFLLPENYSSTSLVQVYSVGRPPDMNTEQIVAQSESVADRAARLLADGTSASELRAATTVGNPQGSQILTFETLLPDAEQAAGGANAYGEAYLAQRAELLSVEGEPAAEPGAVVDLATPADKPAGFNRTAVVAAGAALGLLIGCLIALVVDRLDSRVRNARRMQALFYDLIFVSGKDASDSAIALSVLADRLRAGGSSPRIALMGSNRALVDNLLPMFARQQAKVGADASAVVGPNALVALNAAALGSPSQQVAAAATCDLSVVVATPKDVRGDVQLLADQAALITGKPCVGWFIKA